MKRDLAGPIFKTESGRSEAHPEPSVGELKVLK
jgi:hypothetical protein